MKTHVLNSCVLGRFHSLESCRGGEGIRKYAEATLINYTYKFAETTWKYHGILSLQKSGNPEWVKVGWGAPCRGGCGSVDLGRVGRVMVGWNGIGSWWSRS